MRGSLGAVLLPVAAMGLIAGGLPPLGAAPAHPSDRAALVANRTPGGVRPIGSGSGAPVASAGGPGKAVEVSSFATEPVVLTGADFPDWSSGPELTARAPQLPTDYSVANTQGSEPPQLRSDCYQSSPAPDVNGYTSTTHGDHNCFQGSQLPVRTLLNGVPPATLLGYRWDPKSRKFVQIPFQVDTRWQHYISNNASGFAFYSGVDPMLTYSFDYEPFLYTSNPPFDPSHPTDVCYAQPPAGQPSTTADPNPYLTNNDQLAFMARDAGVQAPSGSPLPAGIVSASQVMLRDPATGVVRYVYVMESALNPATGAPEVAPAFTAANSPYVHYHASPDADVFAYSQSNYSTYGNARKGPVCLIGPKGTVLPSFGQGFRCSGGKIVGGQCVGGSVQLDPATYVQRRTLDLATISTPRYKFRYGDPVPTTSVLGQQVTATLAGRWIMDGLQVSPDNQGLTKHDYGPSIIDRFKGRAFQQSPNGHTPCCGYEDEQVNWNGSSITMGVRVGPVRIIRVTWGADSGTNVTRTDIFYAYSIDHEYGLRVHPIPPLDGIYTQWNMAAGQVSTYYNPYNPKGVPISGINPVLYGDTTDFVGPSGVSVSSNDQLGRTVQSANGGKPVSVGNPSPTTCNVSLGQLGSQNACIYGSFNVPDTTFSGPSPLLSWEEFTGSGGTLVEKWAIDKTANPSPGGAQGLVEAAPYYVDDSCFDDGTGNSPGPQVYPRQIDPTTWGFADVHGKPVAISPAPPLSERPPVGTTVRIDGTRYDAWLTYHRRCWNHYPNGTPYNIPGTATYNPKLPAHAADPPPDPSFGPQGDVRYFEGDIATHGIHLLFVAESDNADATTAVDEIDVVDHQVVLPPRQGNVGAAYTQQFTTPLVVVVTPFGVSSLSVPRPDLAGPGMPNTPISQSTGSRGTGSSDPRPSQTPSIPTAPSLPAINQVTSERPTFGKLSG